MKPLALALCLAALLGACTGPAALNAYERDQLVSVRHNSQNEYTLIVYRDPLGQMRHVLRRHGIFELSLTHTRAGIVDLKERGQAARSLTPDEVTRLTARINDLLRDALQPAQTTVTSEV